MAVTDLNIVILGLLCRMPGIVGWGLGTGWPSVRFRILKGAGCLVRDWIPPLCAVKSGCFSFRDILFGGWGGGLSFLFFSFFLKIFIRSTYKVILFERVTHSGAFSTVDNVGVVLTGNKHLSHKGKTKLNEPILVYVCWLGTLCQFGNHIDGSNISHSINHPLSNGDKAYKKSHPSTERLI